MTRAAGAGARPDARPRPPPSSEGVELEDPPALSRVNRTVEIDPVDGANEPDSERDAPHERTEDVAKEVDSLGPVQLDRAYVHLPAAHGDRRAAGRAQIAHPLDLAPGGPDPAPAGAL